MDSQRFSKDAWQNAREKSEEASQGMFLKLPKDQQEAYVYFIQPPIEVQREGFKDKSKTTTKMIGNVARYDGEGNQFVKLQLAEFAPKHWTCLLYTSPSPRDRQRSRMPSSA